MHLSFPKSYVQAPVKTPMHILMVAKRREAEKQASSLQMSTQKIDIQDQFQISNGLVGDHSNRFSDYFGDQQKWNTGLGFYPPVSDPGLQDHLRNIGPDKLCNSILSRFETPALAFYATERYMGLHQYDGQVSAPSMCPSQHSYKEGSSADSGDKSDNFGIFRGSLNSLTSDNCYENSCRSLSIPCFGGKNHIDESRRVLGKDDASFQYHQDHQIGYSHQVSSCARFGFISGEEKQSPRFSSGGTVLASKTRIRWSQSLHEKFVECVNRLGGSERATPKAILKLMDSDGLTIFHVKSHLQKYRVAKYMPDSSEERTEKSVGITDVSQIDPKTYQDKKKHGLQLREALQLQLDVQRSLHEQLEIQRNLQLRIEEQGKQLKIMFDQQQKSSNSQMKNNQNVDTSWEDHNLCNEDFEISTLDGSYNTHFHSKIS